MDFNLIVLLLVATVLLLLLLALRFLLTARTTPISLEGKHVFITGGSKGIGKAMAIEAVRHGANVTIVARNNSVLEDTCRELNTIATLAGKDQQVRWDVLDVTAGFGETQRTIDDAVVAFGPIDVLICNAGQSHQAPFEDLPESSFLHMMEINYLSAVYAVRAVLPSMRKRKNNGRIMLVSSAAGQLGIYGYTSYAAAKFALRGFAEALQMEVEPDGIRLTVVYPPNTNTEGFQRELDEMPAVTREISGTAGIFSPKDVALQALLDVCHGRASSTMGLDGWMLGALTCGGARETNTFSAFQQIVFMGPFRLVMLAYHTHFARIVKKFR